MKIALVSRQTPFESGEVDAFAAELAGQLRRCGHAVERIRFPFSSTVQQRLAVQLIRFETGGSDLVVMADAVEHTSDWDETIRKILEKDEPVALSRDRAPITDEESLALADTVAAVLAELGSNEIDDLAGTMARHIANMSAVP